MSTTRDDIARWFNAGSAQGDTHLIVVCDTYDHTDYPVYVAPDQDVRTAIASAADVPMTQIMEVYNLTAPPEPQLAERRAYNL